MAYFSTCITFNISINQISQWKNFSFTIECISHYSDWTHLVIDDILDLSNIFKEGGMWVGTCVFISVDVNVVNGLFQ